MVFDGMVGTLRKQAIVAFTVALCIWMIREPLLEVIFRDDTEIVKQLQANVEQEKSNEAYSQLLADFKKRSQLHRRIGTII